jgi:hypothetical protein
MSDRRPAHPDIIDRAHKAAQRQARAASAERRKRRLERAGYNVSEFAFGVDDSTTHRWIKKGPCVPGARPRSHIAAARIARERPQRHSPESARIERPVDKRRASHPLPQAALLHSSGSPALRGPLDDPPVMHGGGFSHFVTSMTAPVAALERCPGGIRAHWKAPPCHGAHVKRTFWIVAADVVVGGSASTRAARLGAERPPSSRDRRSRSRRACRRRRPRGSSSSDTFS